MLLLKRFLLQVIYYAYHYTVFHITNKSNNPRTIHIMEEHKNDTIKGYYGLEYRNENVFSTILILNRNK